MTPCPFQSRVQPLLDGDLDAGAQRAFREHLAGCPTCAAELAAYRRVFALLAEAPLAEPRAALTERVLSHVLPSRARARRWRALGWGYAGLVVAALGAIAMWAARPGSQAELSALTAGVSVRLLAVTKFFVQAASFGLLHLTAAGRALTLALERCSPLARALGAVLGQSSVMASLLAATVVCAAMLWWLRPREAPATRGVRHVGLLGF